MSSLLYLYLVLPKLDIVKFTFSPTGIRLQDFIIIILVLFLPRFYQSRMIKTLIKIIPLCVPSIFVGMQYTDATRIFLGYLRLNEYVCLAFCMLYLLDKNALPGILVKSLMTHVIIAIPQYFLIVPLIDPGRGIYYSSQFSGFMGNAAELTYFSIVILPIILVKRSKVILPIQIFILLNSVKGGFVSFLVGLSMRRFLIILLFIVVLDFFTLSIIKEVINYLKFMSMLELREVSVNSLKSVEGNVGYTGEASLSQRVYKWWNSIGFMYHNVEVLLFGVGYGAIPGAIDGGLVRLALELGLIYFLLILAIFFTVSFKVFFVFIGVNLFFDGYTSSVVAPFLILYVINKIEQRKLMYK